MQQRFTLVEANSLPAKPTPGCPKCGTKVPGRGEITAEGKLLGYTIRVYGEFTLKKYSILKNGKRVYDSTTEGGITFGSRWGTSDYPEGDLKQLVALPKAERTKETKSNISELRRIKNASRWIAPGADVTGDGHPHLVVHMFSGGSFGSSTVEVLELSPRVKLIQKIEFDTYQGTDSAFVDLDKDGYPEIEFEDYTFANWKMMPPREPTMRVVLKYRKGRFRVDTDLMERPPPKLDTLRKLAERLQKGGGPFEPGFVPPTLTAKMLDLIYTGHAQLARKFFNMTWPRWSKGKRRFLADFRRQLLVSPYWPAVRKMDGPI